MNPIIEIIFITYFLINIIGILLLIIPYDTACKGLKVKNGYGYKMFFNDIKILFLDLNILSLIFVVLLIPANILIILLLLLIITLGKIYKKFEIFLTYKPFKKKTK